MKAIEEEIVEWAWMNIEEIVCLLKGTSYIPANSITPYALLQLLKDGWCPLPF